MHFLAPEWLWLLSLVPGLVLLYLWLLRRKSKLELHYPNLDLVKQALGVGLNWRRHVPPALLLAAIGLALLAASRPQARLALPSASATIILGSVAIAGRTRVRPLLAWLIRRRGCRTAVLKRWVALWGSASAPCESCAWSRCRSAGYVRSERT